MIKRIFIACLAAALAACASSGQMTGQPDPNKPRSVFVEPVPGYSEYPELIDYAGIALGRRGYDAVQSEQASYRLRSSLQWSMRKISLSVRLVDAASGHVVYFGECNNPGIGTFMNSSNAVRACYSDALDNLK